MDDLNRNEEKSKQFTMNDIHSFKEYLGLNKARIYNLQHRKKPAELVRKDLISAMKMADHENLNRDHYLRILDPWREEWEKGVQVPVNSDSLPKPVIKPSDTLPTSSKDNAIPDGLSLVNMSSTSTVEPFKLSKTLIKHEDCSETSSSYELDLHDICWLQSVSSNLNIQISDIFMEDVINELEQQCARNIKEEQMGIEYDDHIVCDVCQGPDAEDENEMVFCEICNICVHQACYGILEIPLGDWICNSCRDLGSKKNTVCVLCPNIGGALKPITKTNRWAHVACAYWIPEVKFLNLSLLEPIEIKSIPNWRWNLVCSLCNVKKGAPIMCDDKNCRTSYHVTCAFKQKLKMKIVLNDDKSGAKLKSYCLKHSQSENLSNNSSKEVDYINRTVCDSEVPSKNVNPQYEFWKYVDLGKISHKYLDDDGQLTMNQIVKSIALNPKVLQQIIDLIYNYWKLKRISNYGNSLIKLTFAQKFEKEMQFHQNKLIEFRYHLERLRTLSYMLFRREKIKKNWISTQKEIFINSCRLFSNPDDSTSQEECEIPSSSSEKYQLFNQIMGHHNIYQTHTTIQPTEISFTPIRKEETSVESNRQISSTNFDGSQAGSEASSSSGTSKKQPETTDKHVTSYLIRQIKRLSRQIHARTPKPNPYARVYLNSTSKRKPIDFDQDSTQSIKENDELQQDLSIKDDSMDLKLTLRSPSRKTHSLRSKKQSSSEFVNSSLKRKLDFSDLDGHHDEPLLNNRSNFINVSPRTKNIKVDLDTESSDISTPINDETKRVYNFRRVPSNDFSSNHLKKKTFIGSDSPQSNQKENGCVNLSPRKKFCNSSESPNRPNRRDLSKIDLANGIEKIKIGQNQIDKFLNYTNRDVPKNLERKSMRQTTIGEHFKPNNCLSTEIKHRFRQQNQFSSSRRLNSS